MFENLSLIGMLQKGGVTVGALAILSVLSIGVTLERAWAFYCFRRGLKTIFPRLKKILQDDGVDAARSECEENNAAGLMFKAGLNKYLAGRTAVEEAMELCARQQMLMLEKFLGIIGTIGSIAPFVGLFGTVLGIIRAFHDLSIQEGVGPSAVADGIAEALIATAAGLFVAVPAVIAYNYFTKKMRGISMELESSAAEFSDILFPEKADNR